MSMPKWENASCQARACRSLESTSVPSTSKMTARNMESGSLLLGNFFAFAAGFGQSDGDRLLAALHRLPTAPGLQFAALELVHFALNVTARARTVFAARA